MATRRDSAKRILVLTPDRIGTRMAGPAIRALGLARTLATEHDVTLASIVEVEPPGDRPGGREGPDGGECPEPAYLRIADGEGIAWAREFDVILVQGMLLERFPELETIDVPQVHDLYDPIFFETPATDRSRPLGERQYSHHRVLSLTLRQLLRGDYFLVSSTIQRDFYLGMLAATGRLDPTCQEDLRPDEIFGIVPYGAPVGDPPLGGSFKGNPPRVEGDGRLVLWAGGVWDWLSPEPLIEALASLRARHPDVHLAFLGVGHPNPEVPAGNGQERVLSAAAAAGIEERVTFIPWLDRASWFEALVDADVLVCLAREGFENHLALRSRVLEFAWSRTPYVISPGGATALFVEADPLAHVATPEDLSEVLDSILSAGRASPTDRAGFRPPTWPEAARDLTEWVRQPRRWDGEGHPSPRLMGFTLRRRAPVTGWILRGLGLLEREGLGGSLLEVMRKTLGTRPPREGS